MPAIPESHRDLLTAPVATLATVGPDGRPQLSAIWFFVEGDEVRTSLSSARQKTRNLLRNPVANLFVLDVANPARYLELRGDAELAPDDDYAFADRLATKYGGIDIRQIDSPGDRRFMVTFRPVRVNAVDMSRG
jgi:PPOX class probable F420-dependent enzyme